LSTSNIPASERLLLEAVPRIGSGRVLCTSLGRAQLAAAIAREYPQGEVRCHFLDVYRAARAAQEHDDGPANLHIVCQPDLPPDEIDTAALPLTSSGEAELARELLQQAHQALRLQGRLFTATDNPRDSWLGQELEKLFARVERAAMDDGVLYWAVKTAPLKKLKNFASQFVFRDGPRLLNAVSRPGVFAHRRVDAGARVLLNTMEIHANDRVVDMGCGSGVVAIAAAARQEGVRVVALDSNPRAVQCTLQGAALNGLDRVTAHVNAEGDCPEPGTYDLFLANPPYYSHFRIAEIFLDAARRALRPGGRVLVVSKQYPWYLEAMPARFDDVRTVPVKDYVVLSGVQPGG
jgi:16S rRNA G1207 methylase RsmC